MMQSGIEIDGSLHSVGNEGVNEMMLLGLVFPVMFIAGLAYALGWWRPGKNGQNGSFAASHQTSVDLLKERYARGEITREQYQQMLDDFAR